MKKSIFTLMAVLLLSTTSFAQHNGRYSNANGTHGAYVDKGHNPGGKPGAGHDYGRGGRVADSKGRMQPGMVAPRRHHNSHVVVPAGHHHVVPVAYGHHPRVVEHVVYGTPVPPPVPAPCAPVSPPPPAHHTVHVSSAGVVAGAVIGTVVGALLSR